LELCEFSELKASLAIVDTGYGGDHCRKSRTYVERRL
jgi:hypothetical protein